MADTRIPSLGPRGEGWTLLQVAFMVAIPVAAWWAAREAPNPKVPYAGELRAAGTVLLLGGLLLLFASSALLRRSEAFTALPRPISTGRLVESGPYRLIRHPIYAGLIAASLGIGLIRLSPLIGMLAAGLALVLDLKRRREEAWLLGRYPEYAAYRTRTKAFIPRVY